MNRNEESLNIIFSDVRKNYLKTIYRNRVEKQKEDESMGNISSSASSRQIEKYVAAKRLIDQLEKNHAVQKRDYDYTQRVKDNGYDTSLMFAGNVKPIELENNPEYIAAKQFVDEFENSEIKSSRVIKSDMAIRQLEDEFKNGLLTKKEVVAILTRENGWCEDDARYIADFYEKMYH